MSPVEERLRAYFARRARDPSLAMFDRDEPPIPEAEPVRPNRRRRLVALAGGAALIVGLVAGSVLLLTRDDAGDGRKVRAGPATTALTTAPSTTPTSAADPNTPFRWRDQCLPPDQGSEGVVSADLLAGRAVPAWTSSQSGEWLRARVVAAGLSEPYSAGSAWVVMHGVDGVVFAWVGPPHDTAGLSLNPVSGVESAELVPETPFEHGAYRPGFVDSVVAGGVRVWFLTHPRDAWEAINAPGLKTAPCLPAQSSIRETLGRVAGAASEQPYRGRLPSSAGLLRINPDRGMSTTDSGDQHLIQVGERTLGRPLTLPGFTAPTLAGQDVFVFTGVPPRDTDSVILATGTPSLIEAHTPAGGLDVILFIQRAGRRDPDQANIEDVRRIAIALNRDPFLGQPVP